MCRSQRILRLCGYMLECPGQQLSLENEGCELYCRIRSSELCRISPRIKLSEIRTLQQEMIIFNFIAMKRQNVRPLGLGPKPLIIKSENLQKKELTPGNNLNSFLILLHFLIRSVSINKLARVRSRVLPIVRIREL